MKSDEFIMDESFMIKFLMTKILYYDHLIVLRVGYIVNNNPAFK